MPSFALYVLMILAALTARSAAADSDSDPPLPEHHPMDNVLGLSMGVLPHVLFGAEPYSSNGIIPWTSADAADMNRTNTTSYGIRVGTFYAINDKIIIGLEVPYLSRTRTPSEEAAPALHPTPPKLGYPNHDAVVSLDLRF
jgi:hypothetical protein